jgi:hypothetical protein
MSWPRRAIRPMARGTRQLNPEEGKRIIAKLDRDYPRR